jgi:hypothetical protein
MQNVPSPLSLRGVSLKDWQFWVLRLKRNVNSKRIPIGFHFIVGVISLPFIILCLPCLSFYRQEDKDGMDLMVRDYDSAFRNWQDEFNKEVLIKKGIFMKTKSYCSGTENNSRVVNRLIVFALCPAEIEKLKNEAYLNGDIHQGDSGTTVYEGDLCMHYYDSI